MVIEPSKVNLRAFPIRFIRICLTRWMSMVNSLGTLSLKESTKWIPFSWAWIVNMSTNSVIWDRMLERVLFFENLLFLILNRSKRSLTRNCRSWAEFIRMAWHFLPYSVCRCLSRALPIPSMALSGVRMSWEIVAVSISRKWFWSLSCSYLMKWVMLLAMIMVCVLPWKRIGCCLKVMISWLGLTAGSEVNSCSVEMGDNWSTVSLFEFF